jgi:hypothetical protein
VGWWLVLVGRVLGLSGSEVVVLEAVAVALQREDFGVVDESVDHGGGGGVVAEDLAAGAEGLVAGDDEAGALVAAGDEHEHEVRGLRIEWDVAGLVELCRYRHSATYADTATMPTRG